MLSKYAVTCLALVFAIVSSSCSGQQKAASSDTATPMVEEQRYTFIAQQAIPMEDARYNLRDLFPNAGASLYQLSGNYDLKVTPDSVVAYLPFYGRSFTAPMDPTKGGIKFTSTKFDYKKSKRKGNYEIEITPRDVREVQSLFLSISPAGYTQLRVVNLNRSPIAFNGVLKS